MERSSAYDFGDAECSAQILAFSSQLSARSSLLSAFGSWQLAVRILQLAIRCLKLGIGHFRGAPLGSVIQLLL